MAQADRAGQLEALALLVGDLLLGGLVGARVVVFGRLTSFLQVTDRTLAGCEVAIDARRQPLGRLEALELVQRLLEDVDQRGGLLLGLLGGASRNPLDAVELRLRLATDLVGLGEKIGLRQLLIVTAAGRRDGHGQGEQEDDEAPRHDRRAWCQTDPTPRRRWPVV